MLLKWSLLCIRNYSCQQQQNNNNKILFMEVKSDHRGKYSNLSNWKKEAWKISGLQRDSNPLKPASRRSRVRIPLKPWYFLASSFQLLNLEYLLQWSLFTFIYNRSTIWISYIFRKIYLYRKVKPASWKKLKIFERSFRKAYLFPIWGHFSFIRNENAHCGYNHNVTITSITA